MPIISMMKKVFSFTVLLFLAISSFAQEGVPNTGNRYIFIEGTAEREDQLEFFMTNFVMEAGSAGYIVTEKKSEAAHTMKFSVTSNTTDSGQDANKYVIRISLIRNSDDFENIVFDFFFTDLEEMYMYNRSLFQNATIYIPPLTEEDLILAREPDNRWKNKWIYVRASFNYPITFYMLKGDGLYKGVSLYSGTYEEPTGFGPLEHSVTALPGATLGFEVQFLNFMSLEINFQLSMGDTRSNTFINMAFGTDLKFPVKFENIILVPYAASMFFLNTSPVFKEFPFFAAGAGIQLCARGGKHGAFFADVNYMFSFSDAVMKNPYLVYPEANQLYPKPEEIHYNRSVIGIGIGYKIGFLDRIKKGKQAP